MDNRELTKQFKENKEYYEATRLFKGLWEDEQSHWDGWNYAHCLYLQNLFDDAYNVSKQVYKDAPWFLYNRNLLVRIINDKLFRTTKDSYNSTEIDELFDGVDFTYELLPDDEKSRIEFSVFRNIKIARKYSNKMPYEQILKAFSYLDINLISDKPYTIKFKGREKEIQSNKEAYYSYKTKALLSLGKYEACVECCDEAYENITKFHHDNDVWLMDRKIQALAALGDIDAAIEKSRKLVMLKNNWFLKYSLAQLLIKKGNKDEAMALMCRAAYTREPMEMKVNLLVQLGDLINNEEMKKLHYLFSESIRLENEWNIPNDLQIKLSAVEKKRINKRELEDFWLKTIQDYYGIHFGFVEKISDNSKFGFIKSDNHSFFFRTSNVINGKIKENYKVNFIVVASWDRKKEIETRESDYIFILKQSNSKEHVYR